MECVIVVARRQYFEGHVFYCKIERIVKGRSQHGYIRPVCSFGPNANIREGAAGVQDALAGISKTGYLKTAGRTYSDEHGYLKTGYCKTVL